MIDVELVYRRIFVPTHTGEPLSATVARARQAAIDALVAAAHGATPTHGPRGGKRWTPRSFLRRVAWHVLDHTWEREDRAT